MTTLVLILYGISIMLLGIAVGAYLYCENFGGVIICTFIACVILSVMVAINVDFHKRVETYGTYPDTTITINRGVCDTTIIHKVYKHD